jgi:hypothetical protein
MKLRLADVLPTACGLVLALMIALDVQIWLRPVLAAGFLGLAPGWALARLIGVRDLPTVLTLSVTLSLAVDIAVAMALVWAHAWSPPLGLWLILGLVAATDAGRALGERVR